MTTHTFVGNLTADPEYRPASRARPWGRPGRSGGEAHRAGAFPSHGRGAGGVVDDGADHGRAVDERVGDRGPGGAPRV